MTEIDLRSLRVDGERIWRRLMAMAEIGATPAGGVRRLTLTDEDKAGRDLFVRWCREAGCIVHVDQMGNIFARRRTPGNAAADEILSVLVGSHLDTVPTGGKYDGSLGVLAGLEVIETLNDHAVKTTVPIELVSWTNEEGSRFVPALVGSGVFAGAFDLEFALSARDKGGLLFGDELKRIGYAGQEPVGGRSFRASFELHIEQGPILESKDRRIGIVTDVQGMRWYEIALQGKEAHAGPTPMNLRQDPVRGLSSILVGLYSMADQFMPHGRMTIGSITTRPGVTNTVPGELSFNVDLRHPEAASLEEMERKLRAFVQDACRRYRLLGEVRDLWQLPPVKFDAGCIESVRRAAQLVEAPAMEIISGAGHDAAYIAGLAPTSMIFIPCQGGLSHNELESASKEDVIQGANVLLQAVLSQAV